MNMNHMTTNQPALPLMRPTHFQQQQQQQLSRCYLCEQPKQEYSLARSFSEIICRACLNYEGSERVEQLIAEARQSKGQTGLRGAVVAGVSPEGFNLAQVTSEQNTQHQASSRAAQEEPIGNQTNGLNKQQANDNELAATQIQLPPALRNNCYFLASNDKITTPALRPERVPSIIDVESMAASARVERQDPFASSNITTTTTTLEHHRVEPTQPPLTNHLKRSLTRSSSPTIVVLDTPNAHKHEHQKHGQLATRAKNPATTVSTRSAREPDQNQGRLEPLPRYYCQSSESCLDKERVVNRTFGFGYGSDSTSPTSMAVVMQHGVARNATPCSPSHPLDTNSQPGGALGAKQSTKMNEYEAHRQSMPSYPPMLQPQQQQQQHQQSHRDAAANYEQMSRYQSSAAAAAATAAAYYKQLDSIAGCAHDHESLQRIMQECNVYARAGAFTASGPPPFYMRPQHNSSASQQPGAQARNLQSTDGRLIVTTMTPANDKHIQQASPTGLYGHYMPVPMTSYMTPNGPILCPSQYGLPPPAPPPPPYHPNQLMRPSGTAMPRTLGTQYITSSASPYGPASSLVDKRPPPIVGELFDQESHLRNFLRTTQRVDYNPPLGVMRLPTANPGENQQVRRARCSTPSQESPVSGPKRTATSVQPASGVGANLASEPPKPKPKPTPPQPPLPMAPIDLEKSQGNSGSSPPNVTDEDTSSFQMVDSGEPDTQNSDAVGQKSESSKGEQDSRKQQQQQQLTSCQKDEEKRRRDPATPRRSPASPGPQPKRLALGFSPSVPMMSYETGKEPRAPTTARQPVAKTPARSPTAPPMQQMTRRSHGQADHERGASESRSPVLHSNDKVDSSHQIAAPAPAHKSDENLASPKPRTTTTTTTTTTRRSGNPECNTNGTKSSTKEPGYQVPPPLATKTTGKAYQNGSAQDQPPSSGRGGNRLSSELARETPSSSSSRKSKSAAGHQSNSSWSLPPSSRQQVNYMAANTNHYNPLKCMACKERLEDRHFVQCPSVVAHKFCFGCSKISIERQQADNNNLKGGLDRIFCPSGKRCHLTSEQTPWTFMNSEIETIIRESSRQSGSSTAPGATQQGNKLNGISGNGGGGGGGAASDHQISKQRQQPAADQMSQQNGHSKESNLSKIS